MNLGKTAILMRRRLKENGSTNFKRKGLMKSERIKSGEGTTCFLNDVVVELDVLRSYVYSYRVHFG